MQAAVKKRIGIEPPFVSQVDDGQLVKRIQTGTVGSSNRPKHSETAKISRLMLTIDHPRPRKSDIL
jgi:hypothetical protein